MVFLQGYFKHLESWYAQKICHDYYDLAPRVYHNEEHIRRIFNEALVRGITLNPAEELALLFHDVVYIPGFADNEHASADLLQNIVPHAGSVIWQNKNLTEGTIYSYVDEAVSGIMATKDHNPHDNEVYERWGTVIDLDLHELGKEPAVFTENTFRIWHENAPRLIYLHGTQAKALKVFNIARLQWLINFNHRANIFKTKQFRDLYEAQARENIANEIKQRQDDNSKAFDSR